MFRTYYFSEWPYPYAPGVEFASATRTSMPNRWYNPDAGHDLYHKYIDLVCAADELGLDVMFNEHHATLSCTNAAMPLNVAIAARETKRARLLALGTPLAHRPDPVRVATEMATIDVISEGRFDCGFVRGHSYELSATNTTPIDVTPRMYEGIELIVKAWTSHEGPFNWEGEFFHHRQVNIVPRPFQQPHPPIWITTNTLGGEQEVAARGYTLATIFLGTKGCGEIYRAYRQRYAERFLQQPPPERLAYCAWVLVADTDEEALTAAPKLQDFLIQSSRTAPGQRDVPGFIPPARRAVTLRAHAEGDPVFDPSAFARADPSQLSKMGSAFWGSPDAVFEQLRDFFYGVGGFGNLLGMFQASTMSYSTTQRSMELFSREVLPRFREEVFEPWKREFNPAATPDVVLA